MLKITLQICAILAAVCCGALAKNQQATTITRLPILVSINNAGLWVPIYGKTNVIPYMGKDGQLMVDAKALCGFFAAKCKIDYKKKIINVYRGYLDPTTKKEQGRRETIAFEELRQLDIEGLYGKNFLKNLTPVRGMTLKEQQRQLIAWLFQANNQGGGTDKHYWETPMVPITRFAKVLDFDAAWNPKTRMVNLTVKSDCAGVSFLCSVQRYDNFVSPIYQSKVKIPTKAKAVQLVGPAFVNVQVMDDGYASTTYANTYVKYRRTNAKLPNYSLVLQGDTNSEVFIQNLNTSIFPNIEKIAPLTIKPICLYGKVATKCQVPSPMVPPYVAGVLVYISVEEN